MNIYQIRKAWRGAGMYIFQSKRMIVLVCTYPMVNGNGWVLG